MWQRGSTSASSSACIAGTDGDLGPEGTQRFRGVRTPDRRPHLIRRQQRLHDRPSDDAGGPGHHHRHGIRLRERACEDAAMPDDADRGRIRAATGKQPVSMVPAPGHGAPSNRRWLVGFEDGSSAFAKIAAFDYTAEWLRLERTNYEALAGATYLPRLLGWDDDGEAPALVLEDLAGAMWPPPWTTGRIDAVLAALEAIQATPPPEAIVGLFGELFDIRTGWLPLLRRPDACAGARPLRCLVAGLVGRHTARGGRRRRARGRRPAARRRAQRQPLPDRGPGRPRGLELGVSSGRRCSTSRHGSRASHHEGGPHPWQILPGQGALASLLAGFFLRARRAAADPPGSARPTAAAGSGARRAALGVPRAGASRRPPELTRRTLHLQHAATLAGHGNRSRRLRRRAGPAPQPGPPDDPAAAGDRLGGHAHAGAHLAGRDRPHDRGRHAGREPLDGVPHADTARGRRRVATLAPRVGRRVPQRGRGRSTCT